MSKSLRLTLPLCAVALMLVGWSIQSAMAQSAAKGKITVTVKDPAGAIAANVPVALLKGNVPLPAGGGGRRGGGGGGGGGAGGGAPPASQPAPPAPLMSGTTNDKGVYTFEGVDAGEYTVFAGNVGRGGGRRGGGGPGGAPPGGGAAPGGAPPATGPAAGGAPTGARGRGAATGTLEAGKELQLTIPLQAGRGGGGGGGGRGGGGGGAPGGAPGAGA